MSGNEQSTLTNLRLAIHGVTAPFFCEGTFAPKQPVTLLFKDKTRFQVLRAKNSMAQEKELKVLLDHCKAAPFGDGKKTRYDRRVRDALQLKAESGAFSIAGFDPASDGILDGVQKALLPQESAPISADLYGVNVYTKGGHFSPHKDTPRGSDMFGTLVVCLPSQFWRGEFVLQHRGLVQKFDWGNAIQRQSDPNQLHWAAFFGDVNHQIEEIWDGARVTLNYLLRRSSPSPTPSEPETELEPQIQAAWSALLADETFLPDGGTLGYPCCHLYHQDARFQSKAKPIDLPSSKRLKGRDHLVAATALQAGLKVEFTPYMFENCADDTWQLERFPTAKEKSKLGRQVDDSDLERALPIRVKLEEGEDFGVTWMEPPPSEESRAISVGDSEVPAAARLVSCDYCAWGYFGNESSETDFYIYAALHMAIPKFGSGVRKVANRSSKVSVPRKRTTRKWRGKSD